MARPRSRKERWRDLARSIARQNDLPAGCRLILRNGRTGRMVRDDVVLNHLSLGQALADAEPVSALYDQIRSICLTRLAERGWEPVLLGPGGQACDAKSMGEVRAMPPATNQQTPRFNFAPPWWQGAPIVPTPLNRSGAGRPPANPRR